MPAGARDTGMGARSSGGPGQPRRPEDFQAWLKSALEDPVVRVLLRRCHLTRPQLETLLIDLLAPGALGRPLRTEEKARLRIGKRVSRGSFNRTLRQARENVIKAIYTVLLLGYLGVLSSPELEPYVELGSALRAHLEALKSGGHGGSLAELGELLLAKIAELSRPRSLSPGR